MAGGESRTSICMGLGSCERRHDSALCPPHNVGSVVLLRYRSGTGMSQHAVPLRPFSLRRDPPLADAAVSTSPVLHPGARETRGTVCVVWDETAKRTAPRPASPTVSDPRACC